MLKSNFIARSDRTHTTGSLYCMVCRIIKAAATGSLAIIMAMSAAVAIAEPDNRTLLVNGTQKLDTIVPAPANSVFKTLYSGWHFRSPEIQAMQVDDFNNPGFFAVETGLELWGNTDGVAGKSCASCHLDVESMRGVRAALPEWNTQLQKPVTLENKINACRTQHMQAQAWEWESEEMLGMTALIGLQSRGMPANVDTSGPMQAWIAKGKSLYNTGFGQLNMTCAQCHEKHSGKRLRADHLSQGHTNGFPVYHSALNKMSSIHHRFEGCMIRQRAEPYELGSDEYIALEAYIASRGNGLAIETPSVRSP